MEGDFSEKLKAVLSDPEALAKITAIASGLGAGTQPSAPKSEPANAAETSGQSSLQNEMLPMLSGISDPRLALLTSLKPLLREDKRERIDALAKAISLASLMKNFKK